MSINFSNQNLIDTMVEAAIAEDVGGGDISAALITDCVVEARLICRQDARFCGRQWFEACFHQLSPTLPSSFDWQVADGDQLSVKNQPLCYIRGSLHTILSAERSAINFIQTLSATATAAAFWQAEAGDATVILDTRKTLPLWRQAQKYAVRVGGASNHRMGLFDGVLIKENHIVGAGGMAAVFATAKNCVEDISCIQVEVTDLKGLAEAMAMGAKNILLDNFSLSDLSQAVKIAKDDVLLEASGNIDEATIKTVVATGIARISIGAMTKNIRAIDFSLLVD